MKNYIIALMFLSLCSFNAIAGNSKKSIYTENAPAPIGTYSQAIQFGNTVYIAGQIPVDPKTGALVAGTFSEQVAQVFNNISAIAKASGGDINDTLKLTIYVTDLANFNDINDVMKKYFHEPYPARAVIEIKALPKNALVEIEATLGIG